MIKIGIDPILTRIGPFSLTWHGLLAVLAVIVVLAVTLWLAKRKNISQDKVYSAAIWVIPSGIIGARLIHVIDQWNLYQSNPLAILAFWDGGLALFGGILGGTLAMVAYAKFRGIPLGRFADVIAPGAILAQAVGRIGCTINGDAYGTLTSLPWGVIYTHPNAAATTILWQARHPAPVYEIIWSLLVLALLWRLWGRTRPQGMLFLIYLSTYSFGRFFISFMRGESAVLLGLHQAHIISILILLTTLLWMLYLSQKRIRV